MNSTNHKNEGAGLDALKGYKPCAGKALRVAISGRSGCGNTTVSRLLADTLGIRLINYTFRNIAAEEGVPFKVIVEKAKADFSYDKIVDTRQVEMAREGSCVLGSRLAIWMLHEADLKVYLSASLDERSRRIQKREGGSLEEVKRFTEARDADDARRYMELYGIDNNDYALADLVIDTEKYKPEQIVQLILDALIKKGLVDSANSVWGQTSGDHKQNSSCSALKLSAKS